MRFEVVVFDVVYGVLVLLFDSTRQVCVFLITVDARGRQTACQVTPGHLEGRGRHD
jgi:hypothetical protein